jgi:esterase
MKLHVKSFGEGEPLIILHGLFGSSDNWQTLAKGLATKRKIIVPDLRNHGQSPHHPDWNYMIMAQDVIDLCREMGLVKVQVAGHSMGGKTAMWMAGMAPSLISRMMVIDIGPQYYPPHHQSVFEAIDAAEATGLHSRKEAEQAMLRVLDEPGTVQFLLKNLYWQNPEKLGWRFNLPIIRKNILEVGKANDLINYPVLCPVMFLKGDNSNYLREKDIEGIKNSFSEPSIESIDGAGHWLHAEKPMETFNAIEKWFES